MSNEEEKSKPDGGASVSTAEFGFTVGQTVRLRVKAWQPPNEYSPGGLLGDRGDKLIVKAISPHNSMFPIAVHHPDVTDGSAFCVRTNEIEPWPDGDGIRPDTTEAFWGEHGVGTAMSDMAVI